MESFDRQAPAESSPAPAPADVGQAAPEVPQDEVSAVEPTTEYPAQPSAPPLPPSSEVSQEPVPVAYAGSQADAERIRDAADGELVSVSSVVTPGFELFRTRLQSLLESGLELNHFLSAGFSINDYVLWLEWGTRLGPKLPALFGYLIDLSHAADFIDAWPAIKAIGDLIIDSIATAPLTVSLSPMSLSDVEARELACASVLLPQGLDLPDLIARLPQLIAAVREIVNILLIFLPA